MSDYIDRDDTGDGIDRRGFLKCMAWAGTGVLCVLSGGIFHSRGFGAAEAAAVSPAGLASELSFVQISDSHIGFSKAANTDVLGTLQACVDKINALSTPPAFLLHTGDISHLAKPEEFDAVDQILKGVKTSRVFYVPGEHDMIGDAGKTYLDRYGRDTQGSGWYSFDQKGVHFIALVNVADLKPGGLGNLGAAQLAWLAKDVAGLGASTPIVVFAHVPLWSVYPEWGWATDDGAQALGLLKRFGSVTVLNGHIHQTLSKVEGHVTFHTARSTAFPQPAPGAAPSPGPMVVPAGELRRYLGITSVAYAEGAHTLAVTDSALADPPKVNAAAPRAESIAIDNFTFNPGVLTIQSGASVEWTNRDDIPHTVIADDKAYASPVLDTGEKWSHTFDKPGVYKYFCGIHPMMTGKIVVR